MSSRYRCPYCEHSLDPAIPWKSGRGIPTPVKTVRRCAECGYEEAGPTFDRKTFIRWIRWSITNRLQG